MLHYVALCCVMLRYVTLCCVMLRYVIGSVALFCVLLYAVWRAMLCIKFYVALCFVTSCCHAFFHATYDLLNLGNSVCTVFLFA